MVGWRARGLGSVAGRQWDAGCKGEERQCSYAFGPYQGRKGMKEISSQILIDSFIYKNCKHKYYVN